MFGRHHAKYISTCVFTIHNLRLPEIIQDDFQVEWKRADNSGLTERSLSNDSRDVFFEKRFKCPVTMYVNKKDNSVRPKFINFTVNRFIQGTTKKVFGKFEIDVGAFYNVAPVIKEFQVESPHSKKSTIFLSITVTPDNVPNNGLSESSDLTSVSEAMNLASEKIDDWDVSEAKNEEEQAKINEFFEMRVNSKTTQSLASFQHNRQFKRTNNNGSRMARDNSHSLFTGIPASPPKNKIPKIRRKNDLEKNATSPVFLLPPSDIEIKKDNTAEAKEILKSVLQKQWCSSPLLPDQMPKPAVAVYAALINSLIFDEESVQPVIFDEIVSDFTKRLKIAIIITRATDIDKFITMIYLYFLIKRTEGKGLTRRTTFNKFLLPVCSFFISCIVDRHLDPLLDLARQLIAGAADPEVLVPSFVESIKQIKTQISSTPFFNEFIAKRIIAALDAHMVEILVSSPLRCTFGNSLQLNTFITMMSDKDIQLPLFKESVLILQMGSSICDDPTLADSICPNLPKQTIVKILSNQQPDDFMPMPNDVMKFVTAHNVAMDEQSSIQYNYKGDFSEIESNFKTDNWKSTQFEKELIEQYSFLKAYFE
ncbi:hypothetical protein TVAG_378190 [Trichomonas vaginalis G3]|uniref:C2 NT-type domain-containing protein n=1 Tax=Trichomonas vaginalis (strain ATCC PRA-98 / G3) TaxID=412133 RepID=A2DB10_TRIV3|nr:N-terminal C2 in EEIG1 and EHBP1 proteins family [Trichomonas vaginalis G3]EAY22340.1 hypothetical protein TVAG_378190 [Trichomonas vaginalis G3]KAI5496334.1 N-terminal C2 in EEIG1 and EHBP1 proteins family [Trichomonas vaginalis G3]|eukprot:XP_001583326.1 hypothetical protein [Trichomonas vaginalis G3]